MEYESFIALEKIGSFNVYIKSLKDLDQAVQQLCDRFSPKTPQEEHEVLKLCPYFGVVWPSARALALFISARKKDFNKKQGLEIGCGLALPSIIASKMGAQMTLMDFHPEVESWVQENAVLNHVKLRYASWDWTKSPQTCPQPLQQKFDFILASDILYEKHQLDSLVQNIQHYLAPTGTLYLADPGRVYLEKTIEQFKEHGFNVQTTILEVDDAHSRPIEDARDKKRKIQIFELSGGSISPF